MTTTYSAAAGGPTPGAPAWSDGGSFGAAADAAMPGWHVFADLTPPELMASRRTRTVKIWIAIGLVLVLGMVAASYEFARGRAADAAAAVDAEAAVGVSLRSQQQQFSHVTELQATVDRARQQLAGLMASDVDIDSLIGEIWAALPAGMTISQLAVTVPDQIAGAAAPNAPAGPGAAALDTSDATHVGTVTLSGTGRTIDDVPAFIDKLAAIHGIYSPFPTSNQASADGTTYSLQFTLTDTLLTGRWAVKGDK